MQPPNVTELATDELVDLCFNCLPSMDSGELIQLVEAILRIMEREAQRTKDHERAKLRDALENPVLN